MKNIRMLVLVPAAIVAAACGRGDSKTDDALKNDLALASQAQPYNPMQTVSPSEMGYAYNPATGQFQPIPKPAAQTPVVRTVSRPATVRRTSTARRSTGTSSGTRVVYQPAPKPAEPIRHTARDAAIGAAAGAVIGATVSRDKVKGGLIGAAAGAVLGGVIGHTVDVTKP